MSQIIAIITGLLTLFNYSLWTNAIISDYYTKLFSISGQVVLFIITFIILISYKGKKTRPSYTNVFVKIFTIRYSVLILSFLGNLSILAVLILNFIGKINKL